MPVSLFSYLARNLRQTWDVVSQPYLVFAEISSSQDLGSAWASLAITSVLFSISTLIAEFQNIPMTTQPLLPLPHYRVLQAWIMPLILGAGWLACAAVALLLNLILRGHGGFKRTLAVAAPALFVPMWLMLWPTELFTSLGWLEPSTPGFPGLWVRELMPTCTFLYILFMVWLAFWQSFRLLLREAFAMAVLSILPALALFALLLR